MRELRIEKLEHVTVNDEPLESMNKLVDKLNEIITFLNPINSELPEMTEEEIFEHNRKCKLYIYDDGEQPRTIQLNLKSGG